MIIGRDGLIHCSFNKHLLSTTHQTRVEVTLPSLMGVTARNVNSVYQGQGGGQGRMVEGPRIQFRSPPSATAECKEEQDSGSAPAWGYRMDGESSQSTLHTCLRSAWAL